jgi:phytanoyl-CoA hydroxylase
MQLIQNMMKQFLNILLGKSFVPVNTKSGLWLDWADDSEIKKRQDYELLLNLKNEGYVNLSRLISPGECDELIHDFNEYIKREKTEADSAVDEYGLHSRLCNFHMISKAAKDIAFNGKLSSLLDQIFDSEAVLCSSLFFKKGSEQRIHRDGPFFYTTPTNLFVGVWVALEDIQEGTGELLYYPKGHKIPISVGDIIQSNGGWNEYTERIQSECSKEGLTLQKNIAKKGDVLIWHAELPYGGAAIQKASQSRKSLVFHFKKQSASIFGDDVFF